MPSLQARPTVYKGIQMRSRLEASYAAHLDQLGLTWRYEPIVLADEHRQWLPDFLVGAVEHDGTRTDSRDNPFNHSGSTHAALVEVKPTFGQAMDARYRCEVAAADYHLAVVWPEGVWPDITFHAAFTYKGDWVTQDHHQRLEHHPECRFDW